MQTFFLLFPWGFPFWEFHVLLDGVRGPCFARGIDTSQPEKGEIFKNIVNRVVRALFSLSLSWSSSSKRNDDSFQPTNDFFLLLLLPHTYLMHYKEETRCERLEYKFSLNVTRGKFLFFLKKEISVRDWPTFFWHHPAWIP